MQRSFASRSAGFSLVELMVAIAVSLLLLTGVVAIFGSSRASYESTDQLSRVQETGRFALDLMSRHVRGAGFPGCSQGVKAVGTVLRDPTALQWDFLAGPVRGYEATAENVWQPAIDSSVITPTSGSDVLVVRGPRLGAEPLELTGDMGSKDSNLSLPNVNTNTTVKAGDVAMAFSCEGTSYFHVTTFSGGVLTHSDAAPSGANASQPGNSTVSLNYRFRENAVVVPVETVIYYVRAAAGATTTVPSVPIETTSLWRRVGLNDPEELVEGIEQMQVEYGVDTTGDRVIDSYAKANAVTDWQNVLAVRIALLVRSVQEKGTDRDTRTYSLLEQNVAVTADRRLREVFTATASIRNKVRVD